MQKRWSRREVLKTSVVAVGSTAFAQPIRAALPEAEPLTPALIEAARKEGKIAFYSALELNISEKLARTFEARYPGIAVRVERSGAERIFQRIGQEKDSHINAVDLVCSTDPAHFIFWKRKNWVAPYVTEEMAKNLPRDKINPDGTSATVCTWFSVIGYNTDLVKPEDAPKSYADLLDPKWKGKIVKGHPGYSGAILTATYQISRDLGWEYFEKLAQQKVLQLQSAAEPPRKLSIGERACRRTATITASFCTRIRENQSRLSTPPRARRRSSSKLAYSAAQSTRTLRACFSTFYLASRVSKSSSTSLIAPSTHR